MKIILGALAAIVVAGVGFVQPAAAGEKCVRHDGVWRCVERPSMGWHRDHDRTVIIRHHDD